MEEQDFMDSNQLFGMIFGSEKFEVSKNDDICKRGTLHLKC